MRRKWMRPAALLAAIACIAAVALGDATAPNGLPAPAYVPDSYACYPAGVLPSDIASGDYDSDGWLELVVSSFGTGDVVFYDNAGSFADSAAPGVFVTGSEYRTSVGSLPYATALCAADGGAVAVTGGIMPGVASEARFVSITRAIGPTLRFPGKVTAIDVADLDHSGARDDVVFALEEGSYGTQDISGLAGQLTMLSPSPIVSVAVGDLNQDGWQDVVLLAADGLYVAYNERVRPLSLKPAFAIAEGADVLGIQDPTSVAVADFDSDGLMDIVVVGNNPQAELVNGCAKVFLNSPAAAGARFTTIPEAGTMATWGFDAEDVVATDFDGNGRDDFAVLNRDSNTVAVFLVDAVNPLQVDDRATTERCLSYADREADRLRIGFRLYKLELKCGHHPMAMTSGDYDYNGKADIAVAFLSATRTISPQNASCLEVMFDVACGFHDSRIEAVPPQLPHILLPGVGGRETTTCMGSVPEASAVAPPQSAATGESNAGASEAAAIGGAVATPSEGPASAVVAPTAPPLAEEREDASEESYDKDIAAASEASVVDEVGVDGRAGNAAEPSVQTEPSSTSAAEPVLEGTVLAPSPSPTPGPVPSSIEAEPSGQPGPSPATPTPEETLEGGARTSGTQSDEGPIAVESETQSGVEAVARRLETVSFTAEVDLLREIIAFQAAQATQIATLAEVTSRLADAVEAIRSLVVVTEEAAEAEATITSEAAAPGATDSTDDSSAALGLTPQFFFP